jgi:hypothetical protein
LPDDEYRFATIQAVIAAHRGKSANARRWAEQALIHAKRAHSGLRYHPKLGLPKKRKRWMEKRVIQLTQPPNGLVADE